MPSTEKTIVILGSGGTIAGTAASASDNVGYRSAQLSVRSLVAAIPALAGRALQAEQVAQLDSKDMDIPTWQALARAADAALARPEVGGVVITHGTDTLEETAYLLARVLAPAKPLVLTAAMRPATSLQADGPQNLADAVALASDPAAGGVLVALAGRAFAAEGLRKVDAYRLDAFDGRELARVEEGTVRWLQPPPLAGAALGLDVIAPDAPDWPRVAWVTSHAAFDARWLDAVLASGLDGLVVAGTGNGTLHHALEAALARAAASGVEVRRTTRCASGALVGGGSSPFAASHATGPAQARIELLLELLQRRRNAPSSNNAVAASASEAGPDTAAT